MKNNAIKSFNEKYTSIKFASSIEDVYEKVIND